jgi:hypothetical protein
MQRYLCATASVPIEATVNVVPKGGHWPAPNEASPCDPLRVIPGAKGMAKALPNHHMLVVFI